MTAACKSVRSWCAYMVALTNESHDTYTTVAMLFVPFSTLTTTISAGFNSAVTQSENAISVRYFWAFIFQIRICRLYFIPACQVIMNDLRKLENLSRRWLRWLAMGCLDLTLSRLEFTTAQALH